MEGWNIYGVVGTIIFIIIFICVICWAIKDRNAIMKRARKIDPTVSTLSEAQYVLKKDIAQSVGTGKENDKK